MNPNLKAALDPRSIAVIGASENPDKIGGRPLHYLARFGFRGPVYPVNPKRAEVQGLKTVPRLADLPEPPDLVVIAVPGEAAVQALEECGEVGARIAVMMTSGFGESDPENGKAQERAMAERARARGMRIVGPNSQGLANFGTGAVASFSSMFTEVEPMDGPVGIVSQSGAMSVVPYGLLRGRGIGVRHSHATGNDADVTVCELAAAVAEDPALKLLLLYLESIPDPHHLARAAAVARERDLPIIALKAGRTAAGQAAARSHTGALANEDRVVDAFLESHGIWRAEDTAGLVEAAELYLKGWRPGGRRLVAISNSGATCVMAADAATAAGMSIPRLGEETQARLRAILPGFASAVNPVDITAALLTNSRLLSDILPVIAEDPSADCFLLGIPVAGAAYDLEAFARDTAAFAAATGKPIAVAAPQAIVADPFKRQGLPVFEGEAAAVRALHQLIAHHELMARAAGRRVSSPAGGGGPGEAWWRGFGASPLHRPANSGVPEFALRGAQVGSTRLAGGPPPPAGEETRVGVTRLLNEAESLAVLSEAGIPVVAHRVCRSAEEAVAAARELGGPVAVKGCSRDVSHKSELGLVHLGLSAEDEVRHAFESCRASLEAHGSRFDGAVVARMAKGRREMLLGAHRDPFFGPVVAVGDGGRYVEALPDVRLLLTPFGEEEVRAALGRLRVAPVLGGVRGEPPVDLAPLCRAAVALGRLMSAGGSPVESVDVNPFLLGTEAADAMALDAVVVVRDGPERAQA